MKIGIYVSGLGQSFQGETVEKYATRMMNEFKYNYTGAEFETKIEKIEYADNKESTVVTILKKTGDNTEPIYKFYDFKFNTILTERFIGKNILIKNLILFFLVLKKIPVLIKRIFKPRGYSHPMQTIYLFIIFLIIASAILFILPAVFALFTNFADSDVYRSFVAGVRSIFPSTKNWHPPYDWIKEISKVILAITAFILVLAPQAKVIITSLATEFVCANSYLELGAQSQEILGNLDQLVEYIAEKDPEAKIHYHCYSFGSLVLFDFLFPFGTVPSRNVQQLSEALITIGTPVEFVKAYYTGYYEDRSLLLDKKICWLNIYSASDALATNFRKDGGKGDSEFGITNNSMQPINLNYEITNMQKKGIMSFLFLYSIKSHGIYWAPAAEGHSCLRPIYNELDSNRLL